jgi:hypothetical protein
MTSALLSGTGGHGQGYSRSLAVSRFAGIGPSIMALIVAGLNGLAVSTPRYLLDIRWPAAASSALILRRLRRLPVTGFARWSRFANLTASGWRSLSGSPPSHQPFSLRFHSRAPHSLAIVIALSNSATAPRTWRTSRDVGPSSTSLSRELPEVIGIVEVVRPKMSKERQRGLNVNWLPT